MAILDGDTSVSAEARRFQHREDIKWIQHRITASKSPVDQVTAYQKAVVTAQKKIDLANTCSVEAKATVAAAAAAAARAEELALTALTAE